MDYFAFGASGLIIGIILTMAWCHQDAAELELAKKRCAVAVSRLRDFQQKCLVAELELAHYRIDIKKIPAVPEMWAAVKREKGVTK